MADNHFDLVQVWDQLGGSVRVRRNGTATVLNPTTMAPLTVVENGVSTTVVHSDSAGRVSFVAQQGTVLLVSAGVSTLVTSAEAATSGAANAAAAQAAQAAAEAARDSALTGVASKEPAIAAGTTGQYFSGNKTWQALNKAAVGLGSVDNTSDASKPVSTAQAAAIAAKLDASTPLIKGTAGRQYALQLGTIRNTGSGWAMLSDTNHRSTGFGTVSTVTSDRIRVNYDTTAAKVGGFAAIPDETYSQQGLRCGASVGIGYVDIFLYTEPADRLTDRVFYNGTAWQSERGVFTGFSFSGGVLTLTHEDMGDPTSQKGAGITLGGRGTAIEKVGSMTNTTTQVVFYTGSGGSLTAVTTPTGALCNVNVTRTGRRAAVPATDPSTISSAFGNIWLVGVIEI